jgi:hypothetical protein
MRVDLPAPLGPTKAALSPSLIPNERFLKRVLPAKDFAKFCVLMRIAIRNVYRVVLLLAM